MNIYVAGSGKLANTLLHSELISQSFEIFKWDSQRISKTEKSIVIHAGSGRQWEECIDFCSKTNSILIELSTGAGAEDITPDFPLIICPNISILIVKTLHMLKQCGKSFRDYEISITESHQSSKKSKPGTAYAFAKALNFPTTDINSIRDPEIQLKELHIPQNYLNKHAYHKITIHDGDDEVIIQTRVLGHDSYATGLKALIEAVLKSDFENKKYSILDLVEMGII